MYLQFQNYDAITALLGEVEVGDLNQTIFTNQPKPAQTGQTKCMAFWTRTGPLTSVGDLLNSQLLTSLTARIASFVATIRSPYRRIRRHSNSPHLFLSILHHVFQYSIILSYLEHIFSFIIFTIVDTAIGALLLRQATTTLLFNNGSILGVSGLLRTFISTRSLTTVLFFAGMALSYVLMSSLAPEVLPEYPIVRWDEGTILFTLVTSILVGWGITVRYQTPLPKVTY